MVLSFGLVIMSNLQRWYLGGSVLFGQLPLAVVYTHRKSVLYRDINLMMDHQGNVKLLDFGIAGNHHRSSYKRECDDPVQEEGLMAAASEGMTHQESSGNELSVCFGVWQGSMHFVAIL